MAQPMLGEVELQLVQNILVDENQILNLHSIPALEGDFFQKLGRRISRITLTGVITGTESGEGLRTLREKFRAAELVSFVADIATATKLDRVVIEAMDVRELAGKPERFEYALTLREFIAPPRSQSVIETQPTGTQTSDQTVNEAIDEDADQANADQVNNIVNALGTLEVQVELEDGGDFSSLRVVVEGETTSGESISTWSQDQENGLYRFEGIQEGTYTVQVELQ